VTILSGQSIRRRNILHPCAERTAQDGLTYGLGPAGYDLRLDLGLKGMFPVRVGGPASDDPLSRTGRYLHPGDFLLAATVERFEMPVDCVGRVCDKSSLARIGLSVFNTVIEPGWRGFLTLELVNNSRHVITLLQGQAIAQVLFELTDEPVQNPYDGKYQDQAAGPQAARP
jgi:dCTP deaminase